MKADIEEAARSLANKMRSKGIADNPYAAALATKKLANDIGIEIFKTLMFKALEAHPKKQHLLMADAETTLNDFAAEAEALASLPQDPKFLN